MNGHLKLTKTMRDLITEARESWDGKAALGLDGGDRRRDAMMKLVNAGIMKHAGTDLACSYFALTDLAQSAPLK